MDYLLYSSQHQGWASPTGQYTTEPKDAERFTHEYARKRQALHKSAGFTSFPVLRSDVI